MVRAPRELHGEHESGRAGADDEHVDAGRQVHWGSGQARTCTDARDVAR